MTSTGRQLLFTVVATSALALAHQFLTAGPNPNTGEGRSWSDPITVAAFLAGTTAVIFAVLLPLARRRPARAGAISLVTAVVALLGLPVLVWSGTSVLLGAAAVMTARAVPNVGSRTASARVAIALGATAIAVNVVLLVVFSIADFRPALPS